MFIAHLPFGYMLSRAWQASSKTHRPHLAWGLLGSVFPDVDLLWRWFINSHTHHHRYWTHLPIFWLAVLLVGLTLCRLGKRPDIAAALGLFVLNAFGHMLLDSNVGDIWWLYPFVDQPFHLFEVPRHYAPWWLNFVLHWTFAVELAIVGLCLLWMTAERYLPGTGRSRVSAERASV